MTIENAVLDNDRLIYSIIKKYDKYLDREDLYQVAIIGLVNALNNYDSSYGVKFTTYAYTYILGEVKKYIRENRGLKVNKDLMKLSMQIERARELLSQKLMRVPTITDLSLFLELDEKIIMDAINSNEFIRSLDYEYEDDDNDNEFKLYNTLSTDELSYKEEIMDLKNEINNLDEEEQNIINSRYYDDLTQSEVSKMTGLSQVQVSRKEKKILSKLKKRLI